MGIGIAYSFGQKLRVLIRNENYWLDTYLIYVSSQIPGLEQISFACSSWYGFLLCIKHMK